MKCTWFSTYAPQYQAIKEFLALDRDTITAAIHMSAGLPDIFKQYGEREAEKRTAFAAAQKAWAAYTA